MQEEMHVTVRAAREADLPDLIRIWNQVVEDGVAYPQEELLDEPGGRAFFDSQSHTAVADAEGEVVGLYILHPNNVGRCGHICNCSYAVRRDRRGAHIGEKLVLDSLRMGRELGFRILQFNAVVESNIHARRLLIVRTPFCGPKLYSIRLPCTKIQNGLKLSAFLPSSWHLSN